MDEAADDHPGWFTTAAVSVFPSIVTLSPFTPIPAPSSRRLSSQFTPNRPVHSARKLAWVSLQGRIVNAEEASSARAIGGGLSREEKVAWELFTPIQRFLIVAIIGVAVAESKKNRLISQLKKSVEIRDQILSSMQQKLDDLCGQVNSLSNQGVAKGNALCNKNIESQTNDSFGCNKIKFVDCGCWHCDQHQDLFASLMNNFAAKLSKGDEMLQYKAPFTNEVEHDERRMSDLSDWNSSVTSTAEIQMNHLAIDQDIFNLKRECEEKDTTIKELTTILQSTNKAGSKRITELEELIRRKNMMITRLKKEMVVLEQKVYQLTRLQRPSSLRSGGQQIQLPVMMDNIVYDMDSTTSPSSSDTDSSPASHPQSAAADVQIHVHNSTKCPSSTYSDSSPVKQQVAAVKIQSPLYNSTNVHSSSDSDFSPVKQKVAPLEVQRPVYGGHSSSDSDYSPMKQQHFPIVELQETPSSIDKIQNPAPSASLALKTNQQIQQKRVKSSPTIASEDLVKSRSASPLKEISTNQKSIRNSSLRLKQSSLSTSGNLKKFRGRTQPASRDASAKKRWV